MTHNRSVSLDTTERNYSEISKLLPKGRDIRFDLLLARRDASLLLSGANLELRGELVWLCP